MCQELISIFFFKSDYLWGNTASHTAALVYEGNKALFHKTTHVQTSKMFSLTEVRSLCLKKMAQSTQVWEKHGRKGEDCVHDGGCEDGCV